MRRLAFVTLLLAATCGDPSEDEACADYASAFCQTNHSCYADLFDRLWGDEGACREGEVQICKQHIAARGTRETSSTFSECAKQLAEHSCRADWPSACFPPAGTLPNSSLCLLSSQCESHFCQKSDRELCGVCTGVPTACVSDGDCANPMRCVGEKCAFPAVVEEGQVCGEMTPPCRYPLLCAGAFGGIVGQCDSPLGQAPGIVCDPDLPGACDPSKGLRCDPQTRSCQPFKPRPQPGETCSVDPISTVRICAGNASCSNGKCETRNHAGESCAMRGCLPPAICVSTSSGPVCTIMDVAQCK
jgi:hypothetical protein